jgi:hypothetical protein
LLTRLALGREGQIATLGVSEDQSDFLRHGRRSCWAWVPAVVPGAARAERGRDCQKQT